jgi:hypothetical protein
LTDLKTKCHKEKLYSKQIKYLCKLVETLSLALIEYGIFIRKQTIPA